jgi:hypothetical protein
MTTDKTKYGAELSKELLATITVDFKNVENAFETFDHIEKVRNEISKTEDSYVIHFDCHRNEN